MTGSHRLNGIFLAYGPSIRENKKLQGVKIYDVAPTILHNFGIPIPMMMDGRVLREIFAEGGELAKKSVVYGDTDEKERIRKKLKMLKKLSKI